MERILSTAMAIVFAAAASPAAALEPFVASYAAWYDGKPAGTATMQVAHADAASNRWQVDLGIRGNRGFAGIIGLNLDQNTVFDVSGGQYRPLSQSTVRKAAVLFNRRTAGTYDWNARIARWTGKELSEWRRRDIPLHDGDMSGLLINLAAVRDAEPGKTLHYRFVDSGRVREHEYRVAEDTEPVVVGELSYEAMRVERSNGGNDETIFWIADGVPTPVRIVQRENGEDSLDLRLIEYKGASTQ